MGKMLREARDTDVWQFVTPHEVERDLPALTRHLGQRQRFWEYLISSWREFGLFQ